MVTWEQFLECVDQTFGFLKRDFGFNLTSTKRPFVVFESAELRVSIFYDLSGSCELDVRIRKKCDDPRFNKSIGIGVLKAVNERSGAEKLMASYPKTLDELNLKMTQLAGLLLVYGADLLRGDLHEFDVIRKKEVDIASRLAFETGSDNQ
jgi:hypothetical protein